ncbi:neuropeptide S [Rhynchonycteris naso]
MFSAFKLNLILVLSISAMLVLWGYPVPSPKVSGTPGSLLLLLSRCPLVMDRREALASLKPVLETAFGKRAFRNGVGTGMKKTSFRRAKP